MKASFSRRLVLASGLIVIFIFVGWSAILLVAGRQYLRDEAATSLADLTALAANAVTPDNFRTPADATAFCARLAAGTRFRLTLIRPDGTVIGDSSVDASKLNNHADRPEVRAALRAEVGVAERYGYSTDSASLYVARAVRSGGSVIGVIRAAVPRRLVDGRTGTTETGILVAALVLLVLSLAAVTVLSRSISRPLESLGEAAEHFAAGDFTAKAALAGFPGLGRLGTAFNGISAELKAGIAAADARRTELDAVLTAMTEGIVLIDPEMRIRLANPAARALSRLPRPDGGLPEISGRTVLEAFRSTELAALVESAGHQAAPCEGTIQLYADGQTRYLRAEAVAMAAGPGGFLLALTDITRLTRLERIRQDFVANVSHELKTPITSIKGFVETLDRGALEDPEAARRFLAIIGKHTLRMEAIIDDLLSLARLEESGTHGAIERSSTGIAALLDRAVLVCSGAARERQVTLAVSAAPELAAQVNPGLLEQAVVNLVDNAVKYSPEGRKVDIRAREDGGFLVIEVEDRGCGIPAKDLERIFERFYRVDKARDRARGGTGLGLAIVRHIALLHRGEATVRSVEGAGSVFTIRIPLA